MQKPAPLPLLLRNDWQLSKAKVAGFFIMLIQGEMELYIDIHIYYLLYIIPSGKFWCGPRSYLLICHWKPLMVHFIAKCWEQGWFQKYIGTEIFNVEIAFLSLACVYLGNISSTCLILSEISIDIDTHIQTNKLLEQFSFDKGKYS